MRGQNGAVQPSFLIPHTRRFVNSNVSIIRIGININIHIRIIISVHIHNNIHISSFNTNINISKCLWFTLFGARMSGRKGRIGLKVVEAPND